MNYVIVFILYQKANDSNQKKITFITPLEIYKRIRGSLTTEFIVNLPKTKGGRGAVISWFDLAIFSQEDFISNFLM